MAATALFSVLTFRGVFCLNSTVSKGGMHLDKLSDPSLFVCEKSAIIPFDES